MPKLNAKSKLRKKKKQNKSSKNSKSIRNEELYTINTFVMALYTDDSYGFDDDQILKDHWYSAKIIDIIESGHSYIIEFDDYDIQQTVTMEQIEKRRSHHYQQDNNNNNNAENKEAEESETEQDDAEKYMVGEGPNRRRINPKNDICCICDRLLPLTWHHLIPKCTHDIYLKSHLNITRLFLNRHGIWICRQCHSGIHDIYTNDELMESYSTLDMLLESDKIQKFIKYVSKQKVSAHYDRRANNKNRIANIQKNQIDQSTKIKYMQ